MIRRGGIGVRGEKGNGVEFKVEGKERRGGMVGMDDVEKKQQDE